MPVFGVTFCTLASLATSTLKDETNTPPNLTLAKQEAEVTNLTAAKPSLLKPALVKHPTALPETIEVQPDTAVTGVSVQGQASLD